MYDLCKLMIKRSKKNGGGLSPSPARQSAPSPDPEPGGKVEEPNGLAVEGASIEVPEKRKGLSLNERLSLVSLIDEGMRLGLPESPGAADLFNNLWELVNKTAKGGRINPMKFNDTDDGFQTFELTGETGESLGRLNMLYLKKPIPCYYLVYVEVAPPFRRKGLGNRVLKYFADFVTGKSAIGILDNIIPEEDPTYDIYLKKFWRPVEEIIGPSIHYRENHYMIFIPPSLEKRDLKQPVQKCMYHLKRRRAAIDIRDNLTMVKRTMNEFRGLYQALLTYFGPAIDHPHSSLFMRFLFTRFVTKFIAFRRRIGDLLGYTGGESTEQITLDPKIERLQVKTYAPREFVKENAFGIGDLELLSRLPGLLKKEPARMIESLPNYRRPSFMSWLEERGRDYKDSLTLGDLMDLGFDPTRLKEITIDDQDYIVERVQAKQIDELQKRNSLLERISSEMAGRRVRNAWLKANPVLLIIRDRGNGYVLRRKIDAIHLDEALEQLQGDPKLREFNETVKADRLFLATVREAREALSKLPVAEREESLDNLTPFVSWDLKNNQPRMVIEFATSYLETLWMA
jgi:hypothetical protein